MNDPVYVEAAQTLARKMADYSDEPAGRLQFTFRSALIREPTSQELNRLTQLAELAGKHYLGKPDDAKKMATEPAGPLLEDADVAEMAAWTVVANVILNLDEMFMKR